MAVSGAHATHDPLSVQITKIVSSEVLKGSESLCRLLRYLADQTANHPGSSVKEYQIAVEVFGRQSDFDPRLDSTVRVQTSRLRSKLAEYYAGAGLEDTLIVEVPRGAYTLAVHEREVPEQPLAPLPAPLPARSNNAVWVLSVLCAGLAIIASYLWLSRTGKAPAAAPDAPAASLRTFWAGFLDSTRDPVVVFSNAEFTGRPESGMRYFDAAKGDKGPILDHYTGVGEVLAVHELDRLFSRFGRELHVKRGRLLSLDDAKNNDLVFIGSPSENLTLRDVPGTREFVFSRVPGRPGMPQDLVIANVHRSVAEPEFWRNSELISDGEDYAVVSLGPGLTPNNSALILAGITTIGTQAAVEFVCRANGAAALIGRAGKSASGTVNPFEAVIKVKVSRGVPVASEIIALRKRSD